MTRKSLSVFFYFLSVVLISGALFERHPMLKYEFQVPKYPWIGQQIFVEKEARELNVFLGTSHTWEDVDTDFINTTLPNQVSLNFGVTWFGNDANLVLLRDLMRHRRLRRLFIEIHSVDDRGTHRVFPFLATWEDLRTSLPMSRATFHSYQKGSWTDTRNQTFSIFGYYTVKGIYLKLRELLGLFPKKDSLFSASGHYSQEGVIPLPASPVCVTQFDDSAQWTELSNSFLEMISLAEAQKIPLYFVFLPERNEPYPGEHFQTELSRHGTVVIADFTKLYQSNYWHDDGHLNVEGSKEFTRQLLARGVFAKP
jgi:hypothetical protein